jgi:hypothetical protein
LQCCFVRNKNVATKAEEYNGRALSIISQISGNKYKEAVSLAVNLRDWKLREKMKK